MFEATSRYYNIEATIWVRPDGTQAAYKRRRFLPPANTLPMLVEVTVNEGDRLDNITASTLGDPQQYWRICDANNCMNPALLATVPGQRLRVPVPQADTESMPFPSGMGSGSDTSK
jgi:nucleoid-associated protein YgaU